MHLLQTLPFTEPCDGCDHATEIMTATQGAYLVIFPETATPGDRVYCTSCDCSGIVSDNGIEWGEMCAHCKQIMDYKIKLFAKIVQEYFGCASVVFTREK